MEVFQLIEEHLRSLRNKYLDLLDLLAVRQREGQDYTSLCNRIRELADYARASEITEDVLLTALLLQAMRSDEDKAKIMEKDPDTFDEALKFILELETSRKGAKAIGVNGVKGGGDLDVNRAFKGPSAYKMKKGHQGSGGRPAEGQSVQVKDCGRCGFDHPKGKCKATGQKCTSCGKVGHFWKKCREGKCGGSLSPKAVHVGRVMKARQLNIRTTVGRSTTEVVWLPDTGADCNVLGSKDLEKFGKVNLVQEKATLTAPGGLRLPYKGKTAITLNFNNRSFKTEAHVINGDTGALLGFEACVELGLIDGNWPESQFVQRLSLEKLSEGKQVLVEKPLQTTLSKEELIEEFPNVFPPDDEIGPLAKMAGPPMKIQIKPGTVPVKKYRAAPIPFHWQDRVREQLDAMVKKDIVEKVPIGEVPDWILSMVVVPKSGTNEPRMTVNFQPMNPHVIRAGHLCGVPAEEVAQIPPGMKYFTKLDARHGYWQVELDEESRKMMAFITPWGLYRYKRNAMGLINAGDEHNRRGDDAIAGIPNVKKIVEDILIYDEDFTTHIKRVREVVTRCQEFGITLSRRKCDIAQKAVVWCGYHISEHGYTANPDLVDALKNFPVPKSITDARSFCGMVQQFEALSADLTEILEPIRALTSPKSKFVWEGPQQKAFEDAIQELMSPRVLVHFRQGAKLRLETDAAQKTGLGYALWQQEPDGTWRLLRAGSRALTPTESNYSVTEVELLGVVWSVKKLKLYLRGAQFELVVDHKPLVSILNSKQLEEIETPRILRLKEKLGGYVLLTVWRPGAEMKVVDTFSRYPVTTPTEADLVGEEEMEDFARKFVLNSVTARDMKIEELKNQTMRDPILMKLKEVIVAGFPEHKHQLDPELHEYWGVRDNLSVIDELVLYGSGRIVPPRGMHRRLLDELHAAHQGRERTLARARQCLYWPGITRDVENRVKSCDQCEFHKASNVREPLIQDEMPSRPGEAIAADLFSFAKGEFLVVTDKHSGWSEVYGFTRGVSSADVIKAIGKWMATLGVPVRMTTDGGPQFKGEEFQQFCKKWGIFHDKSSPHHPISNGHAEAAVKAMKSLVKKTCPNGNIETGQFLKGLIEYRNTPRSDGLSTAMRVFGRPTRTLLPAHPVIFNPVDQQKIRIADWKAVELRKKAKSRYDVGARDLTQLSVGDIVRVQHAHKKDWGMIAEIVELKPRGRSYLVRSETGRLYWRNRRFLRPYHGKGELHGQVPDRGAVKPMVPRRSGRKTKAPSRYGANAKHQR